LWVRGQSRRGAAPTANSLAEILGVPRLAAALETASQYRTFDLESVRSILAYAWLDEAAAGRDSR